MFYLIHTYGCQMNVHESEKIAGILESRGYSATEDEESADIIVFNTCCIRENAENRALGNIGAVKRLKKENPELVIVLCGCMPQQPQKAESVIAKFPYIDIIIGTHNLSELDQKLDELLMTKKTVLDIVQDGYVIDENVPMSRSSGLNAWVNIMYGCNNFCTYCIVPYVRGREKSREADEIVREVSMLIHQGYREITLLGQNVNSYGSDRADGVRFPHLLRRLNKLSGEFRIKFMTSHPKDFGDELIATMKDCEKVSQYLHLPVQSGSSTVLESMNRKYTREQYLEKLEKVRAEIPNIGLSSDMMVGFPGETEKDFQATLDLVEQVVFDNLYMFVYSRRSGTVADKMERQVPEDVKTDRIKRLVALQRKLSAQKAKQCIGKTLHVLGEWKDGALYATSGCGRSLMVEDGVPQWHGEFFNVRVTSSKLSKLYGRRGD